MQNPNPKQPHEWDESDILNLIATKRTESQHLDYTQSAALQHNDPKKKEISIEVSSFANADGGTIVYGVAENGREPTGIDGGVDPSVISKEWLENVIVDNVRPGIDGLRVNQVRLSNPAGRVIYVVSIPQTTRGPHQAKDYRYYKRREFKSVPMLDFEIRDVMGRSRGPDLYCRASVAERDQHQFVTIVVGNHASEPAFYAMVDVYLAGNMRFSLQSHPGQNRTVTRPEMAWMGEVYHLDFPWAIPDRLPIWQGNELPLHQHHLEETFRLDLTDPLGYIFAVSIKAPGMSPRSSVYKIHLPVMGRGWVVDEVDSPV